MEKNNKKDNKLSNKNKLFIIIIIVVMVLITIGASYAYFIGVRQVGNTLNITTRIEDDKGTFISKGSNIELNVTQALMQERISNDANAAVEEEAFLNVEYLAGTNDKIICQYDINYEWVSDDDEGHRYTITNESKKEFTYQIFDSNDVPIIPETNFVASNVRGKQYLTTLSISNQDVENYTIQQYKIKAKFYNLEEDQSINKSKLWQLNIGVDNVICGIRSELLYGLIDGNGADIVYGDNEELNININAPESKFANGFDVYVDNILIDSSNYTYSGNNKNTTLTLSEEFINTLEVGNHTVKIVFEDGTIVNLSFSINPPTVEINPLEVSETYVGRTLNLTASTNSKNQNVTWVSDDPSIATVDSNGIVTGVGVGTAHIKAKIGSIESEEVEINVKTNIYNVNITDKAADGTTLGTRTDTCTIFENKIVEATTYEGYTSPTNTNITCQEENNITLTYTSTTYSINIIDTSSNGELGVRTEECTYGENVLVPVGSYTGYSSPEAESILCGTNNTKTYTYTPSQYVITVTDKSTDGTTLGTRNVACTYGVNTTVAAGSYTGYTSPSSTSTMCSTTNNIDMIYTLNTYNVTITDESSNGSTLGTRTESCTYGESYTPTTATYEGYTSPSTQSITCTETNSVTYTYQASVYDVTITDKNKADDTLGTRTDTCTYGESYTPTSGTYQNYVAPTNISSITCGVTNNVTLTYNGEIQNMTVYYKDVYENDVSTSEIKTCEYNEEYTILAKNINGYTPAEEGYMGTCGEDSELTFTYYLLEKLNAKIQGLAGTTGSKQDSDGNTYNWAIVNEEVTVNGTNYVNTIYTGANPDNYVAFNGERWRIIGVYNEDSHGKSGEQLIKLSRNVGLVQSAWDLKSNGVGSTISTNGSNEWSDSQLMFLLNGSNAINKGKLYNGNAMSEYTTSVSGNYIVDKNGYKIMRIDNGSYLTENVETNKSVYMPAAAQTDTLTETLGVIPITIRSSALSIVEDANWKTGGIEYSNVPVNLYYSSERGNGAYDGTGVSLTSTKRSTSWTGKIGLMYPSDYGYATNGGSTDNRSSCLSYDLDSYNNHSDCYINDWLYYGQSSASSKGTVYNQWTLTTTAGYPHAALYVASSNGHIGAAGVTNSIVATPVLYLKANTQIAYGTGTYADPYRTVIDN